MVKKMHISLDLIIAWPNIHQSFLNELHSSCFTLFARLLFDQCVELKKWNHSIFEIVMCLCMCLWDLSKPWSLILWEMHLGNLTYSSPICTQRCTHTRCNFFAYFSFPHKLNWSSFQCVLIFDIQAVLARLTFKLIHRISRMTTRKKTDSDIKCVMNN